ncbi:hypothetical protein PG291_03820 [Riemerella anatipestifer]|nr:hypothetical protein [Riemerella anatipestifer]
MKKFLLFIFVCSLGMCLFSCNRDDDKEAKTETKALITVKKNGVLQAATTVYMFKTGKGPNSSFFTPFHADKQVVTDKGGTATFELLDSFDLNIIDTQTTFYFAVFDGNEKLLGKTAITLKKGETKSSEISY